MNMIKWQFMLNDAPLELKAGDAFLFLCEKGRITGDVDPVLSERVAEVISQTGEWDGEWVVESGKRAWVQPVFSKPGLNEDECLRVAASEAFAKMTRRHVARVFLPCGGLQSGRLAAVFQGIWHSSYRFDHYKSKPSADVPPELIFVGAAQSAGSRLSATAQELSAIDFARDLINEPGSVLPPLEFISRVQKACEGTSLKVSVRHLAELEKEGFGGLVTVGKGSGHEPAMLTIEYAPDSSGSGARHHLVLVGKGVTFDTGGISLKPGDGMWEMKDDMSGAADVCAAMLAISRLKLPVRVTAIACLAENRPSRTSVLPGDIFTAKNGKTVMVDSTDAEGRLILSDGLCEAAALGATCIVDLATLTGAIVRALGPSITGLFSNDEKLAKGICEIGEEVGEKYWPMPLEMEYRRSFDDSVADMKNIGDREGGAITAGLFLQEFVPEGVRWAHLDIAGPAFVTKPWKYFGKGATGFGIATLVELARRLSKC